MRKRPERVLYILGLLIVLTGAVFAGAVLTAAIRVQAAFPDDMEKKEVIAESLYPDTVIVYNDSGLEDFKDAVPGEGFKIRISRSEGDAVYGDYESGSKRGSGWISADTVVFDPEFEHVYATVRAKMAIYTDSTCKVKKTKIRKYSGVILIGKDGNSRQVIYDKGDHYGIGWMKRKAYANNLKYDGRPKQILVDGAYRFRCGYSEDSNGGNGVRTEPEKYPDHIFVLTHVEDDCYTICDQQTGKYLQVKSDAGMKKWSPVWDNEQDEHFGLFHISRINESFAIMNTASQTYYGQTPNGRDFLAPDTEGINTHWRCVAFEKMGSEEKPFVFTQYDPQWCAAPYGSEGCMGTAGCGILAPVNAVYALSGQYMNVTELADYAVKKHYRIEGSGTADGVFKAIARKFGKKYGFSWDGSGKKLKTLKKKLKEGKVAVSHVLGHYVCICAYDEEKDRYLLLDSNCLPKRKDTPFGDWVTPDRLLDGTLASQGYFFYRLRER